MRARDSMNSPETYTPNCGAREYNGAMRNPVVLAASLVFALFATGCTLVGQGNLNIANDQSGIGDDNTTLHAFAPDTGDPFPPPGYLNLYVKGDDFGGPPSYGINGYLYLVRTNLACPQSEGAPEAFTLADVTIVAVVTVTNGSVNQSSIMLDTPAARQSRFALMEIPELAGYPGLHLIERCGTITWS